MTPEGKVKQDVKDYLKSLGEDCWYYMPVPMGYGKKGLPDIIGCYRGLFFSIECKAPGKIKMLTPWQASVCQEINIAMGCALVVDDVSLVVKHFKEGYGSRIGNDWRYAF